jgi:hypothetical protein
MIRSPEACSKDSSLFAPMCLQMMGAAAAVFYYMDESEDKAESYTKQNQQRVYIRLDWEKCWYDSLNDPSFERDIRMKQQSFMKLVKLIRDDVSVNQEMTKRRGGDVSPELCLYLTIRYLSGGHYRDIVRFVRISPATFYYIGNDWFFAPPSPKA